MRTREHPEKATKATKMTEKKKRASIKTAETEKGLPLLRCTTDEEAEKHHIDWTRRLHSDIARRRFNSLQEELGDEIKASAAGTVVYSDRRKTQGGAFIGDMHARNKKTEMYFENTDAVSALFKWGMKRGSGKKCLVDFADFTKAGGGYLNGVLNAQEEAVCAESNLCNILFQHDSYYEENEKDINGHLYKDKALYIPDVIFRRGDKEETCDVITIAAPNWNATKKSCSENVYALVSRIKYIAEIAKDASVDTLLFGAFGCGVFAQSPVIVATASMCAFAESGIGNVVFAVPGETQNRDSNARVFKDMFGKPEPPRTVEVRTNGAENYGRKKIDFSSGMPYDEPEELNFDDFDCPFGTWDCDNCENWAGCPMYE